MFYSQFILAKKGPLGTIWIAAHLERKLRKNQVADTDIGVSVDSIIFPEVPIALRLSSHLLLGVVRIYSRKVGYLFDDCSEALLKIKQAFRSAAVDLPPEESTAPYHSITLPETFDLDDFELPDNEIFQGNYVDHHVSAKEQITLQDTMDGVVYSTSQFGPDERFGDGDMCQIGLDLPEEDALLGTAATPMNHGAFDDDAQASLPPMTPFDTEDNNGCSTSDALKTMLENNDGDQVEILETKPESSEYAEAPATPMPVEEANLSSVQEAFVSDDHLESEAHNIHGEMEVKEAEKKDYSETAGEDVNHVSTNDSLLSPYCHEPDRAMVSESECPNGIVEVFDGTGMNIDSQIETQNTEKVEERPDEHAALPSCSPLPPELEKESPALGDGATGKAESPKKSSEDGLKVNEELKDHETSSVREKDEQSKFMKGLQPCNSSLSHLDELLPEGDKQCPAADTTEVTVDENQTSGPASNGKVQAYTGVELLDEFYNEALKNQSGNDNSNANLDLPAPEKLLSASDLSADKPNDLLLESTPNTEGLELGRKQLSGRKRSLNESAATAQSNSLESLGLQRTVESVPDDDDLLSSILVGRRSSALKMKPTPTPLEVISSKRPRTAQRATASKRKVLMDESMVLLGDMIRQQLMSTEDLRRVRKKAPCTLSEISMIQRQYLEDEIFSEPTLAGVSVELFYMHKETYDVCGTKICEEIHKAAAPAEATKETLAHSHFTGQSAEEVIGQPSPIRNDGEVQLAETLTQHQYHQDEELPTDACITESAVLVDTMEVDELRAEDDMQVPINFIPEDRCNFPDEENLMEKEGGDGACRLSPQHTLNQQSLGKDSLEANMLTEEVNAVSQLCANDLGAETNFPMENCNIPTNHEQNNETAFAAPEEHDTLMLVENNDDTERFGSADVVSEVDLQSTSVPKDDLGHNVELEGTTEHASLDDDEAARLHENMEPVGEDREATYGHYDLENMAVGHDTGFLNVDDDEVDEDNEHLSDAEDSKLLDNSGWSSRTRAVAKYLQSLFDREAVRGKSTLPMDGLLAGKTRKEASRMFFESLVLKTRDYIQVEQGKPFDNINMRPRSKLMKSQF